ncbi:MAG: hypothetical protein ACK55Z_09800, partial [bacterium]
VVLHMEVVRVFRRQCNPLVHPQGSHPRAPRRVRALLCRCQVAAGGLVCAREGSIEKPDAARGISASQRQVKGSNTLAVRDIALIALRRKERGIPARVKRSL